MHPVAMASETKRILIKNLFMKEYPDVSTVISFGTLYNDNRIAGNSRTMRIFESDVDFNSSFTK